MSKLSTLTPTTAIAVKLVVALCWLSLTYSPGAAGAEKSAYDEALVRAAVIFGILRFTEWPESSKPASDLVLCSLGSSASAEAISKLEKIPSIGETRISYHSIATVEESGACHAVIIGEGQSIAPLQNTPTLIICDECNTDAEGQSAIQLAKIEDRIQFKINLDRVEQKALSLSSSLIELAAACSSTNRLIKGCSDG